MTGSNPITKKICGAKLRKRDACCQSTLIMTNGRCKVHGGATPKGMASPHFQTGRFSKYIPSNLLDKYHTAIADKELTSVRDELALLDTYLMERLEKLHSGESKDWWMMLKVQFSELQKQITLNADEPTDETEARLLNMMEQMSESINNGTKAHSVYEQIQPMIEQRRKLVETESKRLKDLDQNITAEKAMAIIHLLAGIVKKHITDPKQLTAISEELAQFVS